MPPRTCIQTKTNGIQCGSPAMRGQLRCYFHYKQQKPIRDLTHLGDISTPYRRFKAICSITTALQHRTIDSDVARALLYAITRADS